MRRLLGLLIGALAALLLVAAPASAHSDLASSNPADGSQVDAVPATITLTFNENLQGTTAKIGVLAGKNDPVQVDAAVSGPTVTVDTSSEAPADSGAVKVTRPSITQSSSRTSVSDTRIGPFTCSTSLMSPDPSAVSPGAVRLSDAATRVQRSRRSVVNGPH